MINVYSKATETPLKADSPSEIASKIPNDNAGKHWIWLQKIKDHDTCACSLMQDCYHLRVKISQTDQTSIST